MDFPPCRPPRDLCGRDTTPSSAGTGGAFGVNAPPTTVKVPVRNLLATAFVTLLISGCAGCTGMRPVHAPPEVLRDAVREAILVHPGDQIIAVTKSIESTHVDVASVDEDFIHGHQFPAKKLSVVLPCRRGPHRALRQGRAVSAMAILNIPGGVPCNRGWQVAPG